jgi:hypothetical protein
VEKGFAIAALAVSLVLAGCISVQGGLNATAPGLGEVNIAVNESAGLPDNLSLPENLTIPLNTSDLGRRVVPQNATVCVFGAPDGLNENYFGSITVLNENVQLKTRFLDEDSRYTDYFDCVVIVIRDDEVGKYLPLSHRTAIAKQVSRGAGLLVFGSGATHAPDDKSVLGWDAGFKDILPVRADAPGNKDPQLLGSTTMSGTLYATGDDPAFNGGELTRQFDGLKITFVLPVNDGQLVAWVRQSTEPSPTSPVYPAIVRTCQLTRPCVYYFAFDALTGAPGLAVNTVQFLASESLGKYAVLRALPSGG